MSLRSPSLHLQSLRLPMPRHYRLSVYVSTLFLALLLAFAAVTVVLQYRQTKAILLSASSILFDRVGQEISMSITGLYGSAGSVARLLATSPAAGAATLEERLAAVPMFAGALAGDGPVEAAYLGWDDGAFFLVRRLAGRPAVAARLAAPEGTAYVVQSRAPAPDGRMTGRYVFYDGALRPIETREAPDYRYDPRERPWFTDALASGQPTVTGPYVFFTTGEIGTTIAVRAAGGRAVAAVDIAMAGLGDELAQLKPSPSARVVVYDGRSRVLAAAGDGRQAGARPAGATQLPVLEDDEKALLFGDAATASVDWHGEAWLRATSVVDLPGIRLGIAVAAPQAELLAEANRLRDWSLALSAAVVLAAAAAALALSGLATRPLRALVAEARSIRALKFDDTPPVTSPITEIRALAEAMDHMKGTIRHLLDISVSLPNERDFESLMGRIASETIHIASARVAAIYLAEPSGRLKPIVARRGAEPLGWLPDELDPEADRSHPVVRAAREGSVRARLSVGDIARLYPRLGSTQPVDVLAVPLRNRGGDVLGVLILSQAVGTFADADQRDLLFVIEAVSGMAATAIETQRLLAEQKRLLEAVIELVADAIDRRSPYTGGHCRRVPAITEMLARAAERATEGVFRDFQLTAEQWEELRIAAWLHDCGKITTPEHIVDKATKLETVHNRVHEIRTRFEVVKREAEVAAWKAIAGGADAPATLAGLAAAWAGIDADFAFVAACNLGSEVMAADDVARLRAIGGRTWTRTLDDTLGISNEERQRLAGRPERPLPAPEPLLADRPEHVTRRPAGGEDAFVRQFTLAAPALLQNRGEIYNLSIARGTLNAEERYKVNEHVIETIRMIGKLPFPSNLGHVGEIAGNHHERIDGNGYPRGLTGDAMSRRARILALADVFEALTASDRPYRRAMTLSKAIAILAEMRDEGHIDPDLFALFLTSGVYRDYAERHLGRDQIDEVDIARYLAAA